MKILAAVDLSPASAAVAKQGAALAAAFSGKMWLMHVADPEPDFVGYEVGPQSVRDAVAKEQRSEHRELQELAGELERQGIECVPLLIQGPTVQKILAEAEKVAADIIVIGSHGKGALRKLLVGSVTAGVDGDAAGRAPRDARRGRTRTPTPVQRGFPRASCGADLRHQGAGP